MTAWMMFVVSPSAAAGGTPAFSSRSRKVAHLWTAADHFANPSPSVQYFHSADPGPYFRSDPRASPSGSVPRGGTAFAAAAAMAAFFAATAADAAFAGVVLAGACGAAFAGVCAVPFAGAFLAAGLARSAAVVFGPTSP